LGKAERGPAYAPALECHPAPFSTWDHGTGGARVYAGRSGVKPCAFAAQIVPKAAAFWS